MSSYDLPTKRAMFLHAHDDLAEARAAATGAMTWLHSDWRPVGTDLTGAEADARDEALRVCALIKNLADDANKAIRAALDG
jgi:hypothetical protein